MYSGTSLLRTLWDLRMSPDDKGFLHSEVVNTLQYYTGTENSVLIIDISTFQRFVIERSNCNPIPIGLLR